MKLVSVHCQSRRCDFYFQLYFYITDDSSILYGLAIAITLGVVFIGAVVGIICLTRRRKKGRQDEGIIKNITKDLQHREENRGIYVSFR